MNKEPSLKNKFFGADSRVVRKTVFLFIQIGIFTFVIALGAIYGGKILDERLGTQPWLMILCGIIGIAVTMVINIAITYRSLREIREILNQPLEFQPNQQNETSEIK